MNFLITMAGRAERFVRAGFAAPKMLVTSRGQTLLEWSIGSLPLELCTRLVFVALAEHERQHMLSRRAGALLPSGMDVRWHWLNGVTRGQAETALLAEPDVDPDRPLVIFNIDTRFTSRTLAATLQEPQWDGVLGSFSSQDPRFSYALVDASGCVRDVREKDVISSNALTGLYTFRRPADFFDTARRWLAMDRRVRGEFYIAPMYADLIAAGRAFTLDTAESVDILGTPEELAVFEGKAAGRDNPSRDC